MTSKQYDLGDKLGLVRFERNKTVREWLSPGSADFVIVILGLASLSAPVIGVAVGYVRAKLRRTSLARGSFAGALIGVVVFGALQFPLTALVCEYWAG